MVINLFVTMHRDVLVEYFASLDVLQRSGLLTAKRLPTFVGSVSSHDHRTTVAHCHKQSLFTLVSMLNKQIKQVKKLTLYWEQLIKMKNKARRQDWFVVLSDTMHLEVR